MKRNSVSTKLFAMLLCVVMVIGCLPLSVFASDWEGDIDLAPEGLNPENPIFLDLIYRWDNEEAQEGLQVMYYITDAEFDPTYFVTYGMPGQYTFSVTGEGDFSVTIDGEEIAAVDGVASKEIALSKGAPFNFAVSAGEGYYIDFQPVAGEPVIPVGADFDNAAILVEGANEATTLLSRQGEGMYYYKWTAPSDGVLTLSFNSYAPNAVFANVEVQYPVFVGLTEFDDGTMEVDVTEGVEYGLIVLVVTDDRSTSEFSIQADFEAAPATPVASVELSAIEVSFDSEILLWTYFIIPDEVLNDDGAYVLVTKDGAWETTEKKIYMPELREQGPTSYGDYLIEQGMASGEFGRDVTYKFYNGEGELLYIKDYTDGSVNAEVSRCVADYSEIMFKNGNDKQKQLNYALLVYGGYSQLKFNVDANNPVFNILPNYGYEIPTLEDITTDSITQAVIKTGDNAGITYTAQEAYLDSSIYHRVYFKLSAGESVENFTFEVEKIDPAGETYTETVIPGYDSYYDEYYVDILNIPAAYLDHMYKVTVTNTVTGNTYVVETSVLAWAKVMMGNTSNAPEVRNLAKAVYFYNQAANEFFGK